MTSAGSVSTPEKAPVAVQKTKKPLEKYRIWFALVAVVVGVIVFLLPLGLGQNAKITLAAFAFTVVMWAFEVMPLGITAVLFSVILTLLIPQKVMGPAVTFNGFTNDTFWLILGSFLLGEATVRTGLVERIALSLMRRGGSSYTRVMIYVWISQFILGALVPSGTVRIAMYIPIIVGIVEGFNAAPDSNLAAGVMMHVYWSSILGATIWYTGTNLNPVAMEISKQAGGIEPSFLTWFVWMLFPSILLTVGSFFIIQKIFPPEKEYLTGNQKGNSAGEKVSIVDERLKALGPWKAEEKRALAYFVVCVGLWVSEPLHGISTSWVAILIGVLLFLPGIGVLKKKSLNNISWGTLLLLGVALGMTKIIKAVHLDTWMTKTLLAPILNPLCAFGPIGLVFGVCIITALIHFLISASSAETAMLTPLVTKYAANAGFNPSLAGMAVARSSMGVFLFPYQTLPLAAIWGTGYMDMKKCLKIMSCMSLFSIVWITALGPYYNWIMTVLP